MKRSNWITIAAVIVFFVVTTQIIHYSWKKSRARADRPWNNPSNNEVETPEAMAERRAKDEIIKKKVAEMIGKAIAESKK